MTTYQAAYAKTIANMNNRMEMLQKTLLSLQYQLNLPEALWIRQALKFKLVPTQVDQKLDLYAETQVKLSYLIRLQNFVARDQLEALTSKDPDFFEKHDLYWWQSALSLLGNPAYLASEIIAADYYNLAHDSVS